MLRTPSGLKCTHISLFTDWWYHRISHSLPQFLEEDSCLSKGFPHLPFADLHSPYIAAATLPISEKVSLCFPILGLYQCFRHSLLFTPPGAASNSLHGYLKGRSQPSGSGKNWIIAKNLAGSYITQCDWDHLRVLAHAVLRPGLKLSIQQTEESILLQVCKLSAATAGHLPAGLRPASPRARSRHTLIHNSDIRFLMIRSPVYPSVYAFLLCQSIFWLFPDQSTPILSDLLLPLP